LSLVRGKRESNGQRRGHSGGERRKRWSKGGGKKKKKMKKGCRPNSITVDQRNKMKRAQKTKVSAGF